MLEPEDRDPSVVTTIDESNPLRRVFPEDTRFTSDDPGGSNAGLAPGGISAGLSDVPEAIRSQGDAVFTYEFGDETVIISVGGSTSSDVGIPTFMYSPAMGMYDGGGVINDIDGDITGLDNTAELSNTHADVAGDFFVTAGGTLSGSITDRIFVVDTTGPAFDWDELTATLPTGVASGGACSYNGSMYVFGGSDTNGDAQNSVQRIDPGADSTTTVGTLPDPVTNAKAVRVDDRVYVAGEVDTLTPGTLMYYDLDTDTGGTLAAWTDGGFDTGPDLTLGFNSGAFFEFEGNLFYIDGSQFFSTNDAGIYNPEEDTWVYREWKSSIETVAFWVANDFYGAKSGVVVDDVYYSIGTGQRAGTTAAYIPERNPPEFE